jgi:polyhydroxyalkanoate synthase
LPTFLYGSRDDHIVPWQTAYTSTQLLSGDITFVLGASGHIAGVINPPAANKRSHWVGDVKADAAAWLEGARNQPGSWWTPWSKWLDTHAGAWVAAPKAPGNRRFAAIEPAPGRYVKAKAA